MTVVLLLPLEIQIENRLYSRDKLEPDNVDKNTLIPGNVERFLLTRADTFLYKQVPFVKVHIFMEPDAMVQ